MQLNSLEFSGYVGQDAEDKTVGNGTRIVSFRMCQTDKGKNGGKDISTWITVKVFGNWCDLGAAIKKGDNAYVRGPLRVNEYEKEGVKRISVEVIANWLGVFKKDEQPAKVSGNSVMDLTDIGAIPF